MKQIKRLEHIYLNLKKKDHCYKDLILIFKKLDIEISVRQLQRDIKEINILIKDEEKLITYRDSKKIIYFKITNTKKSNHDVIKQTENFQKSTNFFNLVEKNTYDKELKIINLAISDSKKIWIKYLKNDVTGDNYNFNQKNIEIIPLQTIMHRGSIYVGGFNEKENKNQLFDIIQLKDIKIIEHSYKINFSKIEEDFNYELNNRFGVTKNIDNNIYDIIIEFTGITGNFIKQHFWHSSQKFRKKGNIIRMEMKCGINRELIGWLFYWMYNCRVVKPRILKDYYDNTTQEIIKLSNPNKPLVYKNIFTPIDKIKQ